jgi:hypothetical protein
MEDELIGFRTEGEWTAEDLAALPHAASRIYDAFLANHLWRRLDDELQRVTRQRFQLYAKELEHYAGGPLWHEFFHEWRRLAQKGRLVAFPWLLPGVGEATYAAGLPTPAHLYADIAAYSNASDRLLVAKVEMASPGGFNFKGIGEVVQQVRELIKDLWYRNSQERQKGKQEIASGELDVIRKYLTLQRDFPDTALPPPRFMPADRSLVRGVQAGVVEIRRLEADGKLLPVAANLGQVL